MSVPQGTGLLSEAPVNVGDNHNRPKVNYYCLCKIQLYAGNSGVSEATMVKSIKGDVNPLKFMRSKNAFSADNQQERIEMCGWIVGFVDGEGSFLVNIFKSPTAKLGWQVFPEFNVSQSEKGIDMLYQIKNFFDCGHIYIHRMRMKKHQKWDTLHKFCVRSKPELENKIIPFFQKYPPKSEMKKRDFDSFARVVKMIGEKKHLSVDGLKSIAEIVKTMVHRKPFEDSSASKFLLSSETIR